MSHNKITVGGKAPDSSGEIAVDLNDLSDVSGTPSTGEALVYGGAGWSPSTSGGEVKYIYIANRSGSNPNYSTSPASGVGTNDVFYVYDSSPENTITGSTIHQTSNWVDKITLPSGKYSIQSQVLCEFSVSTGYMSTWWTDSGVTTEHSSEAFVGDASAYGSAAAVALGHLNIAVNTDIYLKINASSNVDIIANQGGTPAEFSSILILKLE